VAKKKRSKAVPPPVPLPRQPKAGPLPTSPQRRRPVFSFTYADRATGNAWRFSPSSDHAPELFQFLCEMAKLTWAEINAQQTGGKSRHKKHHDQELSSIAPEAQKDIARAGLDEIFGDEIYRFRLGGTRRLWGFRDEHTFHVVWWDPEHLVCPTELD
jgi:hypothetical protein